MKVLKGEQPTSTLLPASAKKTHITYNQYKNLIDSNIPQTNSACFTKNSEQEYLTSIFKNPISCACELKYQKSVDSLSSQVENLPSFENKTQNFSKNLDFRRTNSSDGIAVGQLDLASLQAPTSDGMSMDRNVDSLEHELRVFFG